MIYHLQYLNHLYGKPAEFVGWPVFSKTHAAVMQKLGCGMVIHQPFPTRRGVDIANRLLPFHIDGYLQLWPWSKFRRGYLLAMKTLLMAGRVIQYVGHAGGDTAKEQTREDGVRVRPWIASPSLEQALYEGGNKFRDTWERCISPLDRSGTDIAFDAVAGMDPESPYFKAVDLWRTTMQYEGRRVYAEPPCDMPNSPHLQPYLVCATWDSFENRVKAGRWPSEYADQMPGLVLVSDNLPAGLEVWGRRGRTRAYLELMAQRCQAVLDHGGEPALPLDDVAREYGSITEWMREYS